jgi:uncharacterized protein YgbK (DUF1537 family)
MTVADPAEGLPDGPLVAWYGDDFTGSAAVMEVLAFAGLPAVLFLSPPTAADLTRFPGLRGIGIAGTARSEGPDWMRRELPAILDALRDTGAPILQYKICSTLDSSPSVGSIGTAIEVAAETLGAEFFPVYPAAVPIGRYQAFGTLFASGPGGIHRIDRHPVMSRHPVTPMDEADVARHLALQTALPAAVLTLADLHGPDPLRALDRLRRSGSRIITIDSVSGADEAAVGRLLWQSRGPGMLAVASQGLEYALVAHWRAAGLLPELPLPGSAGRNGAVAAISGSVSPITAAQIAEAEAAGFVLFPLDAAVLAESGAPAAKVATAQALDALAQGRDVLLFTARGPDDPSVRRFRDWLARTGADPHKANGSVGAALGDILDTLVRRARLRRVVISGGDTSGHALRRLGARALTALAPTVPGAALDVLHADDPAVDGLQIALKGGQMGTAGYFAWIREGGGMRS